MIIGKAASGLQYAIKKSGAAVGYCSLTIRCGSRDEEGFHSGIAHFTEHTIFKGTSHKSNKIINSYLDKLGGDLNAFTSREEIVIHATVLKEDIGKAASLLLELATCPTFPSDEIELEKGVVIDEIKSYKDTPADDICDEFEARLFEGHPLGNKILGTPSSVRQITSSELRRFMEARFAPENMALAIVADIDEKKMEERVQRLSEKAFHGISRTAAPRMLRKMTAPPVFNQRKDVQNNEVNAIIGGLAPSLYDTKERFAAILMSNILGGPASNSLLNDFLRERNGWVYGVETYYTQYSDSGIMAVTLGCERCNLEKCFWGVRKVLDRVKNHEYPAERLKAAKRQLLGQLAISADNGETQCLSMGKSLITYGTVHSDEYDKEMIDAITAREICEAASRIFNPDRLSSLIYF
jgi:predicted Zn-dependent peptidase